MAKLQKKTRVRWTVRENKETTEIKIESVISSPIDRVGWPFVWREITLMLVSLANNVACAKISADVVKIGYATDLSDLYADTDGPGGVVAAKMAIADFGGKVNGKPIELLVMDHQNKADVASSKTREWIDIDKVDLLVGGANSAVGLAMSQVASVKKKVYISVGAGTSPPQSF